MKNRALPSRRGVTLIEGLIATVILLVGMVGVLQGLAVASVQNTMANRHTRASTMAQELISAIEQQGRANLMVGATGLFTTPRCATGTPATAIAPYMGDLSPVPASLTAQGFTACWINFDALAANYRALTPGYLPGDDTTYTRVVAVYSNPANLEVTYVGVNVAWRDAGQVRIVKRFTALYDTTTNQTNVDF